MIMRILNYILIILVATVPGFWIENYAETYSVFWTVLAAHLLGRLFGYFEGKRERKDEDEE